MSGVHGRNQPFTLKENIFMEEVLKELQEFLIARNATLRVEFRIEKVMGMDLIAHKIVVDLTEPKKEGEIER
jgi:hypothetical protein